MISLQDVKYVLICTAENLYIILPIFLCSGAVAFLIGSAVKDRVKSSMVRLLPFIIAEFILFSVMLPYLTQWIGIRSFTWGFWYEGGLDFFCPFSAMLGILVGYLLGMMSKRRNIQDQQSVP